MIKSASFRNFKSLHNVDVFLERLTVFVGPNASGKTSILDALYILAQIASTEPGQVLVGRRAPQLLYSRGVTNENIELQCFTEDTSVRVTASPARQASQDRFNSEAQSDTDRDQWGFSYELIPRAQAPNPQHNHRDSQLASHFPPAVLLRMVATRLAEPSYSDRPNPTIQVDGGGLASVLAFMALNKPDRFQELQEHLRSVIPAVKRVRFNRVPVSRVETEVVTLDNTPFSRYMTREYIGDELILDFLSASDVPAHLVSEGTILTLGLIAALLGPERPRLILLDDLDQGLHPKAQRKLVPLLRKILEESQDLQIVATTHSPYIVDELDPKEVRVTWAGEDGVTRCERLDSHPDFERWKDEMWPGEFWSLVGEQWVSNGQTQEGQ